MKKRARDEKTKGKQLKHEKWTLSTSLGLNVNQGFKLLKATSWIYISEGIRHDDLQ